MNPEQPEAERHAENVVAQALGWECWEAMPALAIRDFSIALKALREAGLLRQSDGTMEP